MLGVIAKAVRDALLQPLQVLVDVSLLLQHEHCAKFQEMKGACRVRDVYLKIKVKRNAKVLIRFAMSIALALRGGWKFPMPKINRGAAPPKLFPATLSVDLHINVDDKQPSSVPTYNDTSQIWLKVQARGASIARPMSGWSSLPPRR